MHNQRTSAIIIAIAVLMATVLGAGALKYGQSPRAWEGPLCDTIRAAIAWTEGRINASVPGTDARTGFETDRGELLEQLEDPEKQCDTASVISWPSAKPAATSAAPSATETPAAQKCETYFFANDPNKTNSRDFGPAVENNGVDKVLAEFFRRNELDPALLAENLNVLSIRQDSMSEQQRLSEDLVEDCDGRTVLIDQIHTLFADPRTKISIENPGAQTVGTSLMVPGPNGVPLVEWFDGAKRGDDYTVLQVTLPSGEIIWLNLDCGFQNDKPGVSLPARSRPRTAPARECVSGEPRNPTDGTCPAREGGATPSATPSVETSASPSASPSASASASPTPTPSPTPSSTPTTPPAEICTWDDGSEHPLNPNGTCPKEPAPQPSGVESPVANPVASAAEPSPTAKETPLMPTQGAGSNGSNDNSGTDGHTATETPVDEGGDGVVSDG